MRSRRRSWRKRLKPAISTRCGLASISHYDVPLVALAGWRRTAEGLLRGDGPFVALTAAAVATRTLKVATGVCLVQQRDPIQTAKLVASLDQIAGGRFLFSGGGGLWNAEEMADHGTEFRTRFKLMRERIEAMKEVWTKDKAEYHGEMVDFPEMMASPKPVQKTVSSDPRWRRFPAARRAVRYGDGWAPITGCGTEGNFEELLPRFRQMLTEAGRDPQSVPVTLFGATEDADRLARYRDLGIARVVVMLPSAKSDQLLPTPDRWAQLIRRPR